MIPQNQRSSTWKQWRKSKIGASDAAAIMGVGYKNIGQLFDEKLGLRADDDMNEHIERGILLEDDARECFEEFSGLTMFPQVLQHPKYDWMVASLDGLTMEKNEGVEIKCPSLKRFKALKKQDDIPAEYIAQLQHQMAVADLPEIHFFAYCYIDEFNDPQTYHKIIYRNKAYIKNLILKEENFYNVLTRARIMISHHDEALEQLKDDLYKSLL